VTTTPAMTQARRLASYCGEDRSGPMTPAQTRRYRHKARHARAQRERGKAVVASPAKVASVEQAQPERMTAEAITASVSAPRTMKLTQAAPGKVKRAFRRKV